MANITVTIPDDKIQRIIDAFAAEFGWTTESGLTKAQFTKQQVIEYIKQVTRNYEANLAASTARNTVNTDVNSINIT